MSPHSPSKHRNEPSPPLRPQFRTVNKLVRIISRSVSMVWMVLITVMFNQTRYTTMDVSNAYRNEALHVIDRADFLDATDSSVAAGLRS